MLYLITFLFSSFVFAAESICPSVVIHSKEDMKFTDTEVRLMCGDKKVAAYSNIPDYQASYFLKGFLESRGYLKPKFEIIDEALHVRVGKKYKLKKISVSSKPLDEIKILEEATDRIYLQEVMTPGLLNSLEGQSKRILRENGYPCVGVKSEAVVDEESVNIILDKTSFHTFGNVQKEEIEGLYPEALARYYPYKESDSFDERLLRLNEKRLLRAEVVQGTYYLENCSVDGSDFSMSQNYLTGPPRTFRFGVGASTELGPMARLVWSHNRFGPMASILSGRIVSSFRTQSLSLMADNFFWKNAPRRSVLSELNITRESQIDFEQFLIKVSPASMKWTDDFSGRGSTLIMGPSLESGTFHSKENKTRSYNSAVLEASYNLMSHTYELFDIFPEEGDVLNLKTSFRHPTLGFSDPALKLEGSFAKLDRIGELGKGTIIGGARLSAGTLFINSDISPSTLPPAVKFYGGGSDDIRGFQLSTLPNNDGIGALTHTTLKLETRHTYFFHHAIESFLFVDGGYFGYETLSTTSNLFYSPGFGLRWKSPIGLVQGYWARALTLSPNEDKGNLFYAGLGGAF